MDKFEKICNIAGWDIIISPEDTFIRMCNNLKAVPSDIVLDVVMSGDINSYLFTQDFNSEDEIEKHIRKVVDATIMDSALVDKKLRKTFPLCECHYTQCLGAKNQIGKLDKYARSTAANMWHSHFARKKLNEQTDLMFNMEPDDSLFQLSCDTLKDIYSFTDEDLMKIRYFVEQVKDNNIPPSLQKVLYIWGEQKRTGKTTIASTIISILNGEKDINNISAYKSTLNKELQFSTFDVPKVANSNAVMIDEAFPKDMSKTYSKFKDIVTSRGCGIDVKFSNAINIDCRRNYIFTSNDALKDFIKDWSDRRYLELRIENRPKQVGFDEIFDVWKSFCINSTKPMEWADWYEKNEETTEVAGEMQSDFEEKKGELMSEQFASAITQTAAYTVTMGFFFDFFKSYCGELINPHSKRMIKRAVIDLFGEPNGSAWNVSKIKEILTKYLLDNRGDDAVDDIDVDDLPF